MTPNAFLLLILGLLICILIILSYEFIRIENTKNYMYKAKLMLKILSLCLVSLAICVCLTSMYFNKAIEKSFMVGIERSDSSLGYVSNEDYKQLYDEQPHNFSKNKIQLDELRALYEEEEEGEYEQLPTTANLLKAYSV